MNNAFRRFLSTRHVYVSSAFMFQWLSRFDSYLLNLLLLTIFSRLSWKCLSLSPLSTLFSLLPSFFSSSPIFMILMHALNTYNSTRIFTVNGSCCVNVSSSIFLVGCIVSHIYICVSSVSIPLSVSILCIFVFFLRPEFTNREITEISEETRWRDIDDIEIYVDMSWRDSKMSQKSHISYNCFEGQWSSMTNRKYRS